MNSELIAAWNAVEPRLRRFIFNRVRDKALTDDLVQDTFLRYRTKLDAIKDPSKTKSWIYRVAHNLIVDHFRKGSSQGKLIEEGVHEESNFNDCVISYFRKFIGLLPDKYREALQLSELGTLSQVQLAEQLEISFSGAKSRVQRGRALLKKKIEEQMSIEADRYGNIIECVCKQAC